MSHAERMQKLAGLIDSPDKWNKGEFAVDANGEKTHYASDDACKFCLMGAFWRAYFGATTNESAAGLHILANSVIKNNRHQLPQNYGYISSMFNDYPETTHSDIMNVTAYAVVLGTKEDAKKKEPTNEEQSEY
jgi:hypothetical protein